MKRALIIICLVSLFIIADANDPKKTTTAGFDDYALVLERNVFDATRKPRPKEKPVESRPKPKPKPKPTIIEVTGTALGEGKDIAFFKSAVAAYDAMAGPGSKLGDLTVEKILMDKVLVKMNDVEFTIPVGAQLTDQGKGEWKMITPDPPKVEKRDFLDDLIDNL